ncbi:hypothetical protein PQX77_009756, partial [Marasmius sp. AFHP31]
MYDKKKYNFSPLLDELLGHGFVLVPTAPSTPPPSTEPSAPVPSSPLAPSQQAQTPPLAPSQPLYPPRPIRHGLSGFGRRNSLLLIYVAAFVLANQDALKKQGLRLHFTIFEKQSEHEAGSGYSCQTNSDGALNTGLPGRVDIPTVDLGGIKGWAALEALSNRDGALNNGLPGQVNEKAVLGLPNSDALTSLGLTAREALFHSNKALNSGHPVRVTEKAVLGLASLNALTNLAQCIGEDPQLDINKHQRDLRERNLAALDMFADATVDNRINTEHAFTTRGAVGKIQQSRILSALEFIEENMSELITIERKFLHEVVKVDVKEPQKPKLTARFLDADDVVMVETFDFIHLSNGTPGRSPLPEGLKEYPVFSSIPNLRSVGAFLERCQLLENRVLKSGSRIGITGFSLSAYDFVPLILQHTSMLKDTPEGYDIDVEEAKKYKGLLTFISKTGVPAPPHHPRPAPNPTETTNATPTTILTTKEVHAMLLQKDYQWFDLWKVFLDANVARSLKKRPKDLQYNDEKMSAANRMKSYAEQTKAYLTDKGEPTEVGLLREGYGSIYGGQGFEVGEDLSMAEKTLERDAPLTRRQRAGPLLRRAQLSDITKEKYVVTDGHSNKEFFDEYGILRLAIAASPTRIHNLVTRLFEFEVAKHVEMDFQEITSDNFQTGSDETKSTSFAALFAPPMLEPRADKALQSLLRPDSSENALKGEAAQVVEVIRGQPEYAKGRFLKARDRTAGVTHVMDMGMGGNGIRCKDSGNCPDGLTRSMVGVQWWDTTSIDAAVKEMPSAAVMTVLLSSYAQQGFERAVDKLIEDYKNKLPTAGEYEEEVDSFKSVWEEMNKKRAFLELCGQVARDGPQYVEYTDGVFDEQKRSEVAKRVREREGNTDADHLALDVYDDAIAPANILPFAPPSVDKYFDRFVDFTPFEIERCWTDHHSSHASFNSLTAFAASSPPPTSQIILAIAGSLNSVDDALRGYVVAVERWRQYLGDLKDLEDEVGNIMRDREIL